jgi:hypothetical protein
MTHDDSAPSLSAKTALFPIAFDDKRALFALIKRQDE